MLTPRIIYKPGFTVVGLTCDGVCPDGRKDAIWEELGERFIEIPEADPDVGFGVHTWAESEQHYLAGLAVRKLANVPPGMAVLTFPAHAYAVFMHRGLSKLLPESMAEVFHQWLPLSEYEHSGEFYFEYYDDRFQPNSRDSVVYLWVPVKHKEEGHVL